MDFKQISWKLKTPHQKTMPWLPELSRLRGEALYENGHRPAFLRSDGSFYDQDEFDTQSYHILAYDDTLLIGAFRLLPVCAPHYHCIAANIVGKTKFQTIVKKLFKNSEKIMEYNRLAVHKDYHHLALGAHLCAAGDIVTEQLNYNDTFANGNLHLLQKFHNVHAGGRFFPSNMGPYFSERYNDKEIYLVYFKREFQSIYFKKLRQTMFNIMTENILSLEPEYH